MDRLRQRADFLAVAKAREPTALPSWCQFRCAMMTGPIRSVHRYQKTVPLPSAPIGAGFANW